MLLPGRIQGLMLRLQDRQPDSFLFKESLSVRQGPFLFNEHGIVSQLSPADTGINVLASQRFTSAGGFSHILSHMLKS